MAFSVNREDLGDCVLVEPYAIYVTDEITALVIVKSPDGFYRMWELNLGVMLGPDYRFLWSLKRRLRKAAVSISFLEPENLK